MTRHLLFTILLFLLSSFNIYGQISPGDLTQAHADLEGMSNCTKCHDLGKKVSNTKCLDCHKKIKKLIKKKLGYHSSKEVKNKDCFACHSEHHGRKFDMIRFDEDHFDHKLTGYTLEGEHDVIDCRDCHKADYIADADLKKRKDSFLGLEQKCLSCHDDYHQKTLSKDCIKCHNMDVFRPAPKFDHNDADYKLRGKHQDVDCKKCHKIETRNGKEFQVFTDLIFNDCNACHDDPHNDHFNSKCSKCHTEKSFSKFLGKRNFNHNTTHFMLKGSHKSVDCFSCHKKTSDPVLVFEDRKGIVEKQCVACHEDVHDDKFGDDCAKCHNEESFLSLNSMDFFDHSLTDFALEGKHIGVDCKECHSSKYTDPIDFSACKNCHEDYHNGDFVENGFSPDCNECHSLEKGFDYTLFTLEKHQETDFPLEGAHLATPCFACHMNEEHWSFKDMGERCVDCHDNIHKDFIDEKYFPNQDCQACHVTDNWTSIDFDHKETEWLLEGEHAKQDCRACHSENPEASFTKTQKFKNILNECFSCHEDVHEAQFAENDITDCSRCHNSTAFVPSIFNHDETKFPLDGQHADLECKACHKAENGVEVVLYKIEKFECIDCHQ